MNFFIKRLYSIWHKAYLFVSGATLIFALLPSSVFAVGVTDDSVTSSASAQGMYLFLGSGWSGTVSEIHMKLGLRCSGSMRFILTQYDSSDYSIGNVDLVDETVGAENSPDISEVTGLSEALDPSKYYVLRTIGVGGTCNTAASTYKGTTNSSALTDPYAPVGWSDDGFSFPIPDPDEYGIYFPYFNLVGAEHEGLDDDRTRIVSFTPLDGEVLTGPDINFTLQVYVNPDDVGDYIGVNLTFHNIDQNVLLLSAFSPSDIYLLNGFEATTSGLINFSFTEPLADGNYRINAIMLRSYFGGFLTSIFSEIADNQSHQYVVGTSTFIGSLSQSSYSALNDAFGTRSATNTEAMASTCNPLADFDVITCLAFLFVPDSTQISTALNTFKTGVATHFPVGYLTDFISIISTSTVGSLTVIDATLPILGNPHIELDLNGVLDYILYATTSQFTNASAPSTATFYDITSYYWRIIVYILAVLYIVTRILGAHLMPSFGSYGDQYDPAIKLYSDIAKQNLKNQNDRYKKIVKRIARK